MVRYELEKHGLAGHLKFVMVSSEYAVRKPNALLFATAAARLGVEPEEIWFVGDRLDTDIAGAKAAGMKPVWLRGNKDPGCSDAHLIVDSWEELLTHFRCSSVAGATISFRPLGRSDFPLLQKWLAEPHVAVWWNEPFDPASLEAKYGPRIDGGEPVYMYVIQNEGVPIGWIQWYRWRDFPEHSVQLGASPTSAGIDLAIGEIAMTGRGLGPAAIRAFATNYIFVHTDLTAILADPSASNLRSVAAFRKAGFVVSSTVQLAGEAFQRHIVRLDRLER